MLDIRATHYVNPLSEVEFESIPLTVHIVNVADETGLVTGKFRVYNDTTGLLIHTSDIAPLSLAAGASVDAPALTDFDPPAPADDVYFVIFDGHASNALVPDGINFTLGAFYFDVKPTGMGPAPAAHSATHEDGGSDELDVSGLSGELADDQPALEHGNERHLPDFCPLPSPIDSTKYLRADGSPGPISGLFTDHDCFCYQNSGIYGQWMGFTINAGSATNVSGLANHPGIIRCSAGVGANSGYRFTTGTTTVHTGMLLAGGEQACVVFYAVTITNIQFRLGFMDSTSGALNNGAYIQIATIGGFHGTVEGYTAAAGAPSTTPTSVVIAATTWYRAMVSLNADASLVTFYLYSEAGALLWSDTLATTIPTAVGQECACQFQFYSAAGGSVQIAWVDHFSLEINRALVR